MDFGSKSELIMIERLLKHYDYSPYMQLPNAPDEFRRAYSKMDYLEAIRVMYHLHNQIGGLQAILVDMREQNERLRRVISAFTTSPSVEITESQS